MGRVPTRGNKPAAKKAMFSGSRRSRNVSTRGFPDGENRAKCMHMRRRQGSESAQILRRGTISIVSTSTTRRGRTAGGVPRFCGPHHVTHHSIFHNPAGSLQIYQVCRELTSPSDMKEENLKSVIPLASVALTQVPRCRPRTCVEADWRAHQHATQAIVCFIQGPPSGQQRRIGLMF